MIFFVCGVAIIPILLIIAVGFQVGLQEGYYTQLS